MYIQKIVKGITGTMADEHRWRNLDSQPRLVEPEAIARATGDDAGGSRPTVSA